MKLNLLLITLAIAQLAAAQDEKNKPINESRLDEYIREALGSGSAMKPVSPGSLWTTWSPMTDLARDLRAQSVDDLVTVQVVEYASAVVSGDLKSSRQSSLRAGVTSLAGPISPTSALGSLINLGSGSSIDGSASTARETVVSTTLSARVTHVLPNGYLVLEGTKEIQLNAERQLVVVRGIARPADLYNNSVRSDRLAQLEVRVNGKGVVGDATRRPFFLYRLLMGILPL
jgi:flagellar L-ring protein precursor FlgH